ncbi:MAG: LPS assembly lipoprotein LptE [Glaciecola sp.]|jgi:LPS-assembly lipoprotein
MDFRHRNIVLLALLLCISSCGFAPRGQIVLPIELQALALQSDSANAPLVNTTQRYFAQRGKPFVADDVATSFLALSPERIERRLLSVFATGQVAEYELNFVVYYQIHLPPLAPQQFSVSINREYQDDPSQVLAKSRELNLILDELRQQAAADIWRRLPQHVKQIKASVNAL